MSVDVPAATSTNTCPTCHRPLSTRRLRLITPGQIEIDWATMAAKRQRRPRRQAPPTPRPYPFAPLEEDLPFGDEIICQLLKCSWKTLARWRSDGLTADQADKIAIETMSVHPTHYWRNYGQHDLDDLDDLDDEELDDVG